MITNPNQTDKTARDWYALYTRPRFEKKVNGQLEQKGLESLLPLRQVLRIWSDRKKKIEEPMFPSYVFIHGDAKERYMALQTDGVMRIVSFQGQPARIPEGQIKSISLVLEHGYDPEPHSYLHVGEEVEIVAGPLIGLRGFYIEDRGSHRLVISLAAIRQSVAIEVDRGLVRPVTTNAHIKNPLSRPVLSGAEGGVPEGRGVSPVLS